MSSCSFVPLCLSGSKTEQSEDHPVTTLIIIFRTALNTTHVRTKLIPIACLLATAASAQKTSPAAIDAAVAKIESKTIAWRRDLHQHPELGNREVRTAKIIADHLRSLGIETKTGVAHTGVVGVLKGGRPGPVILLRADMDGLPVEERNNLPFRSRARGCFAGDRVP